MRLFIWIPIKNEERIIYDSLKFLLTELRQSNWKGLFQITAIENHSSDQSFEAFAHFPIKTIRTQQAQMSIWDSIEFARKHEHLLSENDIELIYPVDGKLTRASFDELFTAVIEIQENHRLIYGGFSKAYFKPKGQKVGFWFKVYSGIQNVFFFRWKRQLVWTHYLFASTFLLNQIQQPKGGFLEDLQISDQLKEFARKRSDIQFVALAGPALVSARRYDQAPKGGFSQVVINAWIWLQYRLGFKSYSKLKKIYNMDSKCK
jgi:hypothetical protein